MRTRNKILLSLFGVLVTLGFIGALVGANSKSTKTSAPTSTAIQTVAAETPAAKKARLAKAKAAAKAQAESDALEATQEEAAAAAANAWHKTYYGPTGTNSDIYFKYPKKPCRSYATTGCWHVEVVAENGCGYLDVSINEIQKGVIVGDVLANQLNVPPHEPVLLELDTDRANVSGSQPAFTCNP